MKGLARIGMVHATCLLALAAIVGLFFYPVGMTVGETLAQFPEGAARLVTGNLGNALPKVLLNTAVVVGGGTLFALVVGALLAWVNERTDAELGIFGELLPLASLLVPPIAGVIGWAVLLDPRSGLLNHLIQRGLALIGLPIAMGPFNIYTMGGLIAITGLYIVPYVYLVVSAALRRLDPSIEEASRVFAAGPWRTLFRITLPAIRPALAAAALLGIITGLGLFSVPIVLGSGAKVDVLSVFIFRLLDNFPPQTASALVLAGGMMVLVQLLLVGQRYIAPAGRHAAISGRGFHAARVALGSWRLLVKGLAVAYLAATSVLPIVGLMLVSLQPFWTPMIDWQTLSLDNFREVLANNEHTSGALINSFGLGIAVASIAMLVTGLIMLHFHWGHALGKRVADGIFSLPATMPHTVIGIGFLLAFSGVPFRLYGSVTILLLAYLCMSLPYAARAAASAASSIGLELAEASRVFGASEQRTFRRILFPLALPGLLAGWVIVFIHTAGEVTASAFLAGTSNPAIGRVLMELWIFGSFPQVAALALVMTVVSATLVGVMLALTRRAFVATVG